ncbi:MAG: [protein-PII] uridylyltransferase [Gammaproteobacteria bacterium]|nr:[protein-PII] uridylyltransferase [Gammaproteobacteria bacterium]
MTAFLSEVIQPAIEEDPNAIGSYRNAIKAGRDAVHQQFKNGAPISQVLDWSTELVDMVLQALWTKPENAFEGLTLLAVGGYGRGELLPASDIDLAILIPESLSPETKQRLTEFVTSLWDLGLDIGHSVRTVKDCKEQAAADITVITNLMEARYLAGEDALYQQMVAAISPTEMWPSKTFFAAKMNEQSERRRKFSSNAYRLEPNIKESRGGLRDIQMISWVCQREFGTRDLTDLVTHQLLTVEELGTLQEGLELLWQIRYWLHHMANRREDRLLFDHQRDIAHEFGYLDDDKNRCIEQLMQRFYRSVMTLQRLNEILLQGVGGIVSGITAATEPTSINSRFQVRNGFLEVTHEQVFVHHPTALLEIFLIFGQCKEASNVRSNTVRLIRSHLPLINHRFRSDPKSKELFLKIFTDPSKLTRKIRMMNRYGVLAAYLPAFDAIVGRMQYDLFHTFTVDEHTTRVIRNIRRFAIPAHKDEYMHCTFVMEQIEKPEYLYLAALFHDIAKGRGGDHSELGAVDALEFCLQHGLSTDSANLISWVVQNHLLMSITTQRKDIEDPAVQLEFAQHIGSLERLNFLYLLTVADIRATNPELWNSFKQSMLQSLYQFTAQILEQGLERAPEHDEFVERRQAQTLSLLADSGIDKKHIEEFWTNLGDDIWRQYRAVEVARHTRSILSGFDGDGSTIVFHQSMARGATEILIYTPDNESLFALITSVLGEQQLDVLSATINTSADGYALDTFHVLELDGSRIEDPNRINTITTMLNEQLRSPEQLPALTDTSPNRRVKHFDFATVVEFDENRAVDCTVVHITAADRPGILARIGRIFLESNVSVQAAKIVTLGERIEDAFYVKDKVTQSSLDDAQKTQLADLLCKHL